MKCICEDFNIKELGSAVLDTLKRKPAVSILKIATAVATVALAIIFSILLAPIMPVVVVVAITALYLLLSSLITYSFYFDVKESLFAQFKKNHSIDKVANREVVLVLEAVDDHNGAFQQDQRSVFNQIKKNFALAYEKVSNIMDIANAINKVVNQNNKIKALWLRAHGSSQAMCLDKNTDLTTENIINLENHFKQIDPNGYIVLDSCKTAKNHKGWTNIAKKIAQLAVGCFVIASSRSTNSLSIKVDNKDPLNVKMWTQLAPSKNCLLKYPSSFINTIKYLIFSMTDGCGPFKNFAHNATKIYRYPSPLI
jgi:hypothetical protein